MTKNVTAGARRHKHLIVASDLEQRVQAAEWSIGERLPAIPEFMDEYGHSRATIHKAVHELSSRGYVRIEQGNGTFVRRHTKPRTFGLVISDATRDPQSTPFAYLLTQNAMRLTEQLGAELRIYFQRQPNDHSLQEPPDVPGLDRDLEHGRLDGLLTASCNLPKHLDVWPVWQRRPVPLVTIGDEVAVAHRVVFDAEAIRNAFLQLCGRLGKTRIAAVGYSPEGHRALQLSAQARDACGVEICEPWLPSKGSGFLNNEHFGFEAVMGICSRAQRPDAILVMGDILGKGAASAILALGQSGHETPLLTVHVNRGSNIFYPVDIYAIESDPEEYASAALELLSQLTYNPAMPAKTVTLSPSPAQAMRSPFSSATVTMTSHDQGTTPNRTLRLQSVEALAESY